MVDEGIDAEMDYKNPFDHNNPFDDHSESHQSDKKKKKKKKKRSKKRYTSEEISETETLLDELLSFEDEDIIQKKLSTVISEDLGEQEKGINPFDDPPQEKEDYGNEYDKDGYDELLGKSQSRPQDSTQVKMNEPKQEAKNTNPFAEDDESEEERHQTNAIPFGEESDEPEEFEKHQPNINPFEENDNDNDEDDKREAVKSGRRENPNPFEGDDDEPIEDGNESGNRNPFEDDSIPTDAPNFPGHELDEDSSVDSAGGHNPFDDDVSTGDGKEKRFVLVQKGSYEGVVSVGSQNHPANDEVRIKEQQSTDDESEGSAPTEEEQDEGEESEEDIVESSKRLLRMADQRIQYQQQNDEIKQLKGQVAAMKAQAEAMSEQLRRAIETKCDLVLAQTEMERCHEQELICRDDELKDMKMYAQEMVEKGAVNEVNFMNEISSLSKTIQDMKEKHRDELREKDFMIAQLEMKMTNMKTQSVRGSSQAAFKSRFLEKIDEGSECSSVSADAIDAPPQRTLLVAAS